MSKRRAVVQSAGPGGAAGAADEMGGKRLCVEQGVKTPPFSLLWPITTVCLAGQVPPMICEDGDKDWCKWEYALKQLQGTDPFASDLVLDDVCLEVRSSVVLSGVSHCVLACPGVAVAG